MNMFYLQSYSAIIFFFISNIIILIHEKSQLDLLTEHLQVPRASSQAHL